MGLVVDVSIGPDQLTGIPVDIAFDDQNNLGGVTNHCRAAVLGRHADPAQRQVHRAPRRRTRA